MWKGIGTVCFPPQFLRPFNFLRLLHDLSAYDLWRAEPIRDIIKHSCINPTRDIEVAYGFNFRVDRSLGSKELESAREGERERDERTERKRARTDGTMVVLPDVVDTMATGTSLRVESRVGSHWHFKMSVSPLAMHCLSFRLPASRLWTISVSVLRGFVVLVMTALRRKIRIVERI